MKKEILKSSILIAILGIALWSCKKEAKEEMTNSKINSIALISLEVPEKYKSHDIEIESIRRTEQKVIINNKEVVIPLIEKFSKDGKIISIETSKEYLKELGYSISVISNNLEHFEVYMGDRPVDLNSTSRAWRLFGRSETSQIGVNELVCGEGCNGIRYYYDHYFFGFKTRSSFNDDCNC